MKLNNAQTKLLIEIMKVCLDNKICFILSNKKFVKLPEEDDKYKSRGFFDEESKILAVGTKNAFKKWFGVLIHEYNHLLQFLDGKYCDDKYNEAAINFWNWLDKKIELNKTDIKNTIKLVREYELDCEKRTATIIRKNKEININVNDYIRSANAYMYFYTLCYEYRSWYKKPPTGKKLLSLMPNEFVKNYNIIPNNIREELKKCF